MITAIFVVCVSIVHAHAQEPLKFPGWQNTYWINASGGVFVPDKPRLKQEVPLTPEYQAIYEAGLAAQEAGMQGNDQTFRCLPPGMPRAMIVYTGMEIAITGKMTYIMIESMNQLRR